MSTTLMYSVSPRKIEPFVENVEKIIREKNLEAWQRLYAALEATSQKPEIKYGKLFANQPLMTRIHESLPALSAKEVPAWNSLSLRWLLREAILIASDLHLVGGWDKFASWFMVNLGEEELERKAGAELEEHQLLMSILFSPPRDAFPQSLQILQLNETAFESLVTAQQLSTLIEVEDRVGLLRRLTREYCGSADGIIQGLGIEIGMIDNFLRLLRFRNSGLYYFQWVT
jgi:hypothetical protein